MRRGSRALFAVGSLASVAATGADTVQMAQGRWQETLAITNIMLGDDKIPAEAFAKSGDTRYACLGAKDAASPKLYFTEVHAGDECAAPNGDVANGQLTLTTQCQMDKKLPMKVDLRGTYERESYHLNGIARAEMDGRPFTMTMTVDGVFQGKCTGSETE